MRINDMKTQLIAVIDTITELESVVGYETELDIFPTAIVKYRGTTSSESATRMFTEVNKFSIAAVYAYDKDEDAEDTMIDLTEKIIDAIQNNRTLNDTCQYVRITDVREGLQDEQQKVKAIEIDIECTIRVQVN